jgi:hypothetical protein
VTYNWLHEYLGASVRRNLCTRIYCTTCGATEFRHGLLQAVAMATNQPPSHTYNQGAAVSLAQALADMRPSDADAIQLENAGRYVIFDICRMIGECEAERILGQNWGGNVLRRMQEHNRNVLAARSAKAEHEDPARVQERREEKRRVAKERHEQRLALKEHRDRAWRDSQGKRGS